MKRIKLVFAGLVLVACGGEVASTGEASTGLGEELEQTAQAYRIKPQAATAITYGVRDDYDRSACATGGGEGQQCRFLASANPYDSMQVNIRVGNGFTPQERQYIEPAVDAFCASLTSKVNDGQIAFPWSCTRVSSGENLLLDYGQRNANSTARKGDYIASYFDGCNELISSTPGHYQVCAYARVYFDPDELDIRLFGPLGYTPSGRQTARRDIISHGLFSGIGVGTNHSYLPGKVMSRDLADSISPAPIFLTATEVCQLRSWYILVQDGIFFTLAQGNC